jgi:quercetin dioxygenase-like cupin family protein
MGIRSVGSHAVIGFAGAIAGYVIATGHISVLPAFAQEAGRAPAASTGQRSTVRLTERDPGNGSAAHRHPGSHTVGYILEGTYEVKIGDGPLRVLKAGEVFYEAPNALHAVSRNASATLPLKYLVIQVADPAKPATVPE